MILLLWKPLGPQTIQAMCHGESSPIQRELHWSIVARFLPHPAADGTRPRNLALIMKVALPCFYEPD